MKSVEVLFFSLMSFFMMPSLHVLAQVIDQDIPAIFSEKEMKNRAPKAVILKNKKTPQRFFYIKASPNSRPGKAIKFRLKNDSITYNGNLEKISNDGLIISGEPFALNDFSFIKVRPVGFQPEDVVGTIIVAGITGATAFFSFVAAVLNESSSGIYSDGAAVFLLIPASIVSVGATMFYVKRRFEMDEWHAEIVELPPSRKKRRQFARAFKSD